MMAEVAGQTARTPRQVYAEESVRTMFLTWACVENGRSRPLQALVDAFASSRSPGEGPAEGVLPGGRGSAAANAVREAAERAAASGPAPARPGASARPTQPLAGQDGASAPPPPPADPERAKREAWWAKIAARRAALLRSGVQANGTAAVAHIDDPGALSVYRGEHPVQKRIAAGQGASLSKVRRGG